MATVARATVISADLTKPDQKKRGRFLGGTVPFGWGVGEDGALMEVPQQQATIQQILTLRREGLSLRSIAAKIGRTVSRVTVKNILAPPRGVFIPSRARGQRLPAWVRRAAHWQGRAASAVCKKRSRRVVED
jgi:hypothetical protein